MTRAQALTPIILTFNEAENLARTLASLSWAKRVVVLDSGSTDATTSIARTFPNVALFARPFDNHRAQWEYALRDTGVESKYALALDADMAAPPDLPDEFERRFIPSGRVGAFIPFEYRIHGTALLGSMLRPQLRLFSVEDVSVVQEGHTQKFYTAGPHYQFTARLRHDDRKPLERWVASQLGYSRLELRRLTEEKPSGLRAALRRAGLMPVVAGLYSYARAGGPLRGDAAARYACERVVFECLLAMRLMEDRAHTSSDR